MKIVIPPMPTQEDIDLGLRYVNNDMCYPAIVVIGQLLKALKSGEYYVKVQFSNITSPIPPFTSINWSPILINVLFVIETFSN